MAHWVDRVSAAANGGCDDVRHIQVGLRAGSLPDAHRLVRQLNVQRLLVCIVADVCHSVSAQRVCSDQEQMVGLHDRVQRAVNMFADSKTVIAAHLPRNRLPAWARNKGAVSAFDGKSGTLLPPDRSRGA